VAVEASSSSAVGTLLNGTYRLERVIAEGGMGVVYEAAHVRLPRRFAVKLLGRPSDQSTALLTLARFKREAEIASTLAHPHIVEVFDFQVAESGAPYLVMEMLEGEDLADRLKKGRVPAQAALRIIREIAEALDVAHTAGVVHRDLKPANIFLSHRANRDDFVKVLDFGVSKLIDSATLTQEKAMVGTPLYMSPEQAVGTQELTPESDIFSLGAISFEMLTGRRAFAASSIPSILYQIVHGMTPKLAGRAPGLSAAVDDVFAKVLAKRKEERYRRASHFAQELAQSLDRLSPIEIDSLPDDNIPELDPSELEPAAAPGEVTGADETEVESSTRAEEAMPEAVASHPSVLPVDEAKPISIVAPEAFSRSYTDVLKPKSRAWRALLVVAMLAAAGGGVAAFVMRHESGRAAAIDAPAANAAATNAATANAAANAAAANAAAANAATANAATENAATAADNEGGKRGDEPAATDKGEHAGPVVTQLVTATPDPAPTARAPAFAPDPVSKHEAVQFVFHVMPRGAEITVDDKRVDNGKLTLPYQARVQHRVVVRAPGYHTLSITAPSTANRTFELRLDRAIVIPAKKPSRPSRPAHDAAPVQDL
jgi:serine/threonine protein kinase